ncbi:MAG: hypothetical protein GXY23_07140 [Myxococcales bacterium]|nr:hypothetical protein [Myxococcales bacterium]
MGEGPNGFAKLVLLLWPIVSLIALSRTRNPVRTATSVFFAGFLLLPEQTFWKIPGLPEFGKNSIVPLWVLLGLVSFHRPRLRGRFRLDAFSSLVLATILACGTITGASNGDALRWGATLLPGITAYDGFQMALGDVFVFFVPFYLARVLYRTREDLNELFRGLVKAALWVSPIALFEMRMSPQLHNWFYGFIPIDSWDQVVRAGGYRPLGFTRHGLAFVLYFFAATLAAIALRRERKPNGRRVVGLWVAPFLAMITFAFGSLGAALYTMVGIALLLFVPARLQLVVALVAGLFVLSFPYQRWHDTFPTEKFVENARAQADEERAQSLEFRFLNEEMLLERVKMRPIVGWGEFGRANVYDTFSGRRITVRDGAWIIQFGDRGLLGLVWMFGMLVLPLIASVFAAARARKEHRRSIAALAVLLAIGAIDLLPNGAFHPLAFTFAGAMLGQLAALGARVKVPVRVRRARRSAALVPA